MIEAEWLFRNHQEHVGLEKALQCRILQLRENSADETIESMELPGCALDGMPRGNASSTSRTEYAAMEYEAIAKAQREEIQSQLQKLHEKLARIHQYLMLHSVIKAGLSDRENWIVDQYYHQSKSIETMLRELELTGEIISKSTLRRERLRVLEKAQRIIVAVTEADRIE